MIEIGGYFGLEQLISNEYYKDLIPLNSARNALLYILRARNIGKLYIPYYLCDSVSKLCDKEEYQYKYYRIKKDFTPAFERALADDEYIYIVNYFGQISNEQLLRFKEKYKRVIVDNVQAFFQKPIDGVDTIYSCRKFFGVPDGAYLSTDCLLQEGPAIDISMDRMKHVLGRFEGKTATDYYLEFKRNDETFKNLPLRAMSKLTHNILGAIDYERVRLIREDNYALLNECLGKKNKLKIYYPIGPYAYPLMVKNGDNLRKYLQNKKIYVAKLWPNMITNTEAELANNIIPLPCDQRYSLKHMEFIVDQIEKYYLQEEQ